MLKRLFYGWSVPSGPLCKAALKKNRFVLKLVPIGNILLIWLLMIVDVFSFSSMGNEVDVLPSARQFVQPDWLPNDWYLNLDIGYRHLFNLTLGTLISRLGFEYGSYVGRLLVYFLFALAVSFLFRTLRLRLLFGFLVLLLFLKHQSLIADEWIIGGVDTKTISYAFAILSFTFFIRRQYRLGFAFAGAAISFHTLVGGYALYCIAVATLLNKAWRSEWHRYISRSWPFFITGYFGLQAIIKQLLPLDEINAATAWEIYVKFRVPHHVLPVAWHGHLWIVKLVLATSLFLVMYFMGKSSSTRFLAAYALGSVSLFLLGLTIYIWGETHLLKYYWFRFPDAMVPFMSAVSITLVLNDIDNGRLIIHSLPNRFQPAVQRTVKCAASITLILVTAIIVFQSLHRLQTEFHHSRQINKTPRQMALEWISENTPKDAIFLVDPTMSDFYIYAQRAIFVSWRHSPQSASDILEWYERIKLSNGNRNPEKRGYSSQKELSTNFYHLDDDQIRQIANSHRIGFYLGLPYQQLPFERLYSNSSFAIYKVDDTIIYP